MEEEVFSFWLNRQHWCAYVWWCKINSRVGGVGAWVLICCYCGKANERVLHHVTFTSVPSYFPEGRGVDGV